MHQLKSFSDQISGVDLHGEILLHENKLTISFQLSDGKHQIRNGLDQFSETQKFVRAHELWKDTCFESFWSEPGSKAYWELNYSTSGKWNLYFFNDYRIPSPPQESFDFELKEVHRNGEKIELVLKSNKIFHQVEASLCVILKTNKNETYYFSTSHQGAKPDFHIRKSFNLKANL